MDTSRAEPATAAPVLLRRCRARDHDVPAPASPIMRTTGEATRGEGGPDEAAGPHRRYGIESGVSNRRRPAGTSSAESEALRLYLGLARRLPEGRAADWWSRQYRLGASQFLCDH